MVGGSKAKDLGRRLLGRLTLSECSGEMPHGSATVVDRAFRNRTPRKTRIESNRIAAQQLPMCWSLSVFNCCWKHRLEDYAWECLLAIFRCFARGEALLHVQTLSEVCRFGTASLVEPVLVFAHKQVHYIQAFRAGYSAMQPSVEREEGASSPPEAASEADSPVSQLSSTSSVPTGAHVLRAISLPKFLGGGGSDRHSPAGSSGAVSQRWPFGRRSMSSTPTASSSDVSPFAPSSSSSAEERGAGQGRATLLFPPMDVSKPAGPPTAIAVRCAAAVKNCLMRLQFIGATRFASLTLPIRPLCRRAGWWAS